MSVQRQLPQFRRICIVSAVNPYPVSSGKDLVLSGIVRYCADLVGPGNVHYVLIRPRGQAAPADFPVQAHLLAAPTPARKYRSVVQRALLQGSSLQEALLYDQQLAQRLRELVSSLRPDVVLFDTVRTGQYACHLAPDPGQRRLIYLDDLFSARYEAILRAQKEHSGLRIDALGQYAEFVPASVARLARNPAVQQVLLRWERRSIAAAERRAVTQFERCLLLNPDEARLLRSATGARNVAVIPPYVEVCAGGDRAFAGEPEFVFLGNLALPHNDDGLRWFLDAAMGDLLDLVPAATLRVIGRHAGAAAREAARPFGGHVRFEGYVADLDATLSRAAALVAPLRFGSGVKIKLIEALSHALPAVTTTVGASGVVTDNASGLLVEDDIAGYPAALAALLDVKANAAVSRQARRHFEERFSPEALRRAYAAALEPEPDLVRHR